MFLQIINNFLFLPWCIKKRSFLIDCPLRGQCIAFEKGNRWFHPCIARRSIAPKGHPVGGNRSIAYGDWCISDKKKKNDFFFCFNRRFWIDCLRRRCWFFFVKKKKREVKLSNRLTPTYIAFGDVRVMQN